MGRCKGYMDGLERYLSGEKGKRVLNFLYSWGASIVILGALFKLLHWPYANHILFVAMVTESVVFFLSAFGRPGKEYPWEDIFPSSRSRGGMGCPGMSGFLNEEDSRDLSESIRKLSDAAGRISQMAELTDATSHYVEQVELLNRNISGLNVMYETQLNGLNSQFEAVRLINAGLGRIRERYEGAVADSAMFRGETDKMTRQLAELNQVYARLLQAMTVNMGYQQQPPVSQ